MVTNYARGASYERLCVKALKKQGYTVANRSAGSHGLFDVFGIALDHVIYIQVKSTPGDASKAIESIESADLCRADNIIYEVWEKRSRGWRITRLR